MDDLPPPTKVTLNSPNSPSDNDPLFEAKINNPFKKFFDWFKSLIKNEGINIKIKPLTAIGIAIALTGSGGIIGGIIVYFFPHNSPILHREVIYQGELRKTEKSFFLTLPNSDLYTLKPKLSMGVNFQNLPDGQVVVKGNLTPENFVIEVAEIIPLDSPPQTVPISPISLIPSNTSNTGVDLELPKPYPNLKWETTQKRVLIFTSGKRKIEQEGIYLASAQITAFPQDFINYYIEGLKSQGFKETLNAINPEGIKITYAKDDLFLTFGIKNVYKGTGNNKQIAGFVAYLEHN